MCEQQSLLFDFSRHADRREDMLALMAQFAGLPPFRSAVVDELELDEDFYRRPLRPEDLPFIKFRKPVTAGRLNLLPSLASQRMLLCINELGVARLPHPNDPDAFLRFSQFYAEEGRVLGELVRSFLEDFAFSFTETGVMATTSAADLVQQFRSLIEIEAGQWGRGFKQLTTNKYVEEGLRFILIQKWCLLPTRKAALSKATALGYFDTIRSDLRPQIASVAASDAMLQALAERCGVSRRQHSYWQFYQAPSLTSCNLLHALASRPDRALALQGASFVAEAVELAFGCLIGQAAALFDMPAGADQMNIDEKVDDLVRRFERVLGQITASYGHVGFRQFGQGMQAAMRLAEGARKDLAEQLGWLGSIDQYLAMARMIESRIQAECPDIDRDTFVEPRDMCSTTHVHNDHRLVVIESGRMVFWGNLGMRLHMEPGDMVLIPQGRLHGSTVISDECTYHQPIIPDAWVKELTTKLNTPRAAE